MENLLIFLKIYPFFKRLTILRKAVETVLDPRLVVLKWSEFLLFTCCLDLCMLYSRTFKKTRHISKWIENYSWLFLFFFFYRRPLCLFKISISTTFQKFVFFSIWGFLCPVLHRTTFVVLYIYIFFECFETLKFRPK